MIKWTCQQRRPSDLIEFRHNPRKITKENLQKLKDSLDKFGLVEIPVINADNTIIAGHQRIKVLMESGQGDEWIPVMAPERLLSEAEVREYNVRSNLHYGEWLADALETAFTVEQLRAFGMDTDLVLKKIAEDKETHIPLEENVFIDNTPSSIKYGDIFQMGEHVIICGDSQDPAIFKDLLDNERIALTFTSPPYNMGKGMYSEYGDNLPSKEYIDFNMKVVQNTMPYLSGFLFWNLSYNRNSRWEYIDIFHSIAHTDGLQFLEQIIWNKKNARPLTTDQMLTRIYEPILAMASESELADLEYFILSTNKKKYHYNKRTKQMLTNYWELWVGNNTQTETHQAAFPVELPKKAIRFATNPQEIVFDPFNGLGSTLIAADELNRKYRGIELSPKYVEHTIKRYAKHKGSFQFKHLNGDLVLENFFTHK